MHNHRHAVWIAIALDLCAPGVCGCTREGHARSGGARRVTIAAKSADNIPPRASDLESGPQRRRKRIQGRPGDVVPPMYGPAKDSAAAVRIATRILNGTKNATVYRTQLFVSVDAGYLVELVPAPVTPGGGGLFWIESNGSARVLRRYR
jgi:hypothetical protein